MAHNHYTRSSKLPDPAAALESATDPDISLLCSDAGAHITTSEQLLQLLPGADPAKLLIKLIGEYHAEKKLRLELSNQVASLSERMDRLESGTKEDLSGDMSHDVVRALEERHLRSEAYSGRNTAVIAGLQDPGKEETSSDLLEQVLDTLSVAHPDIAAADLSICHRNAPRRGKHKGKPRSVTVVFLRASLKDAIMTRESRGKIRNRITDHQTEDNEWGNLPPDVEGSRREEAVT